MVSLSSISPSYLLGTTGLCCDIIDMGTLEISHQQSYKHVPLSLAYFALHNVFKGHPFCSVRQNLTAEGAAQGCVWRK